jgi:hypothetical protein
MKKIKHDKRRSKYRAQRGGAAKLLLYVKIYEYS